MRNRKVNNTSLDNISIDKEVLIDIEYVMNNLVDKYDEIKLDNNSEITIGDYIVYLERLYKEAVIIHISKNRDYIIIAFDPILGIRKLELFIVKNNTSLDYHMTVNNKLQVIDRINGDRNSIELEIYGLLEVIESL